MLLGTSGSPKAEQLSSAMPQLQERDWYGGNNNARYAFLVFVIAMVVVIFVATCSVNMRRIKAGRRPLVSQYLAPPSYRQSQRQYHNRNPENDLPQYTEEATPMQDVGFYDSQGHFVTAKNNVQSDGTVLFGPPPAMSDENLPGTAGTSSQAQPGAASSHIQQAPQAHLNANSANPQMVGSTSVSYSTGRTQGPSQGQAQGQGQTQTGSDNTGSNPAVHISVAADGDHDTTNYNSYQAPDGPPTAFSPPAGPPPSHAKS